MRPLKRTIPLLFCVGLVGLLLAGVVHASRPSPSPLDRAQVVARTASWISERGRRGEFPLYYWSAGNVVTYFSDGKDGRTHLFQQPIAQMDAPAHEGPDVNVQDGFPEQLSPDGKWFVAWNRNRTYQRIPTFVAMEGGQRFTGTPTNSMEAVWAPGDRHELLCDTGHDSITLEVYHPDASPVRKIVIPGLLHLLAPQRVDSNGRLIGFVDGDYIMHYPEGSPGTTQNYPSIMIARVDPSHPTIAPEQWKAAVPENAGMGRCLLSPAGDRLLWIIRAESGSNLIRKLKGSLPGAQSSGRVEYHWSVSDLKGENLHEIAAYPINTSGTSELNPCSSPCWMPDGKHISFIYQSTLYMRPVD